MFITDGNVLPAADLRGKLDENKAEITDKVRLCHVDYLLSVLTETCKVAYKFTSCTSVSINLRDL